MPALQERNLEALIYSDDHRVMARCAEAFSELPIDWVNTEDASMASKLLAESSFDFVILDLDSPSGTALLPRVRPNSKDRQHAVVLGITGGGIDADILEMSYESLIFYPVRPEQISSEVYRAMPLAERVSRNFRRGDSHARELTTAEQTVASGGTSVFGELRHLLRVVIAKTTEKIASFYEAAVQEETRYALSIAAQERAASLISAAGTIWYVHEITKDFNKLAFLVPSTGPTELIGVSVLLWLLAKHRRSIERHALEHANETNY